MNENHKEDGVAGVLVLLDVYVFGVAMRVAALARADVHGGVHQLDPALPGGKHKARNHALPHVVEVDHLVHPPARSDQRPPHVRR